MKPAELRRFRFRLLVGALLTTAVVLADWAGSLDWLERRLHDLRCRYCQFFLRKPAPPLHVDIDEPALQEIGGWPWPRERMAVILDALYDAGANVVAMDVLFSESKPVEDKALAETIAARGNTVIAVELNTAAAAGDDAELALRLRKVLEQNLELAPDAARSALQAEGFRLDGWNGDFGSAFVHAREEAMFQRISAELDAGRTDADEMRLRLLPAAAQFRLSPLNRAFRDGYDRVLRVREMRRFMRPPPPAGLPLALRGANRSPPVLPLALAAAGSGFTNYDPDPDGVVRAVPLWLDVDGRMLPQFGFATVLMAIGVKPEEVRITSDAIIVPRKPPEHDISIPVSKRDFGRDKGVAYCMSVPMFGTSRWESMYDVPRFKDTAEHISALGVYRIALTRQRIVANQAVADAAIVDVLRLTDPEAADNYVSLAPQVRPRDDMLKQIEDQAPAKLAELSSLIPNPPQELAQQIRLLKSARSALAQYPGLDRQLRAQLEEQRCALADRVKGRTIFIGWIAEGQVDFVTTPIHQRCPGAAVHGAVFNAVMSGELWAVAPPGSTLAITIVLGLITSFTLARLSPGRGLLIAVTLAAVYAVANGVLLFDYGDLIVGAAAPMTVIAMVSAGMTLARVIAEIRERDRITSRFRSYVDPHLVNYVVEHPELARLEGEVREMTIVFTDIVGFTTFTERLGAGAVKVLSRYKSRMVPIIRKHRGFVHCFMGDGIMFSYGAPEPNGEHAADAVATVLEMHQAMEAFNREIVAEGCPAIAIRAGVSTGNVIVGDSGSEDACDYAALGDATNVGARLESANKVAGTKSLISERTAELLDGKFLLRPIARLVVAGKSKVVMAFEPLCPAESATETQRQLVALTTDMVDHFIASRFADCIAAAECLDQRFGPSKLTHLYRDVCRDYLAEHPQDFCGQIITNEK